MPRQLLSFVGTALPCRRYARERGDSHWISLGRSSTWDYLTASLGSLRNELEAVATEANDTGDEFEFDGVPSTVEQPERRQV